jgi:hypothetical protein
MRAWKRQAFGWQMVAVCLVLVGCHGKSGLKKTQDGGMGGSVGSPGGQTSIDVRSAFGGSSTGSDVAGAGGFTSGRAESGGVRTGGRSADRGGNGGGQGGAGESDAAVVADQEDANSVGNDDTNGLFPPGDAGAPKCLFLQPLSEFMNGCYTGKCVALDPGGACPAGSQTGGYCTTDELPCGLLYGGAIPCCVPIPEGCDTSVEARGSGCACFSDNVCGYVRDTSDGLRGAVCYSARSRDGRIICSRQGP